MDINNDNNSKLSHLSDRIQTLQMLDQHCQFLRDGKLFYSEPKLRAGNHICVAEKIIFFRVFRQTLESNPEALKKNGFIIPPNYADLIAALVQDSDEGLSDLCHRIDSLLSPFQRNEELAPLFQIGIEKAIRNLSAMKYYGLNENVFKSIQHSKLKIPWHLSIFRWEVHDISLFPPDMQQVVSYRRQARDQMSFVFSSFINALSPTQKESIITTKHRRILPNKEIIDLDDDDDPREADEKRKKKEEERKRKEEERKKKEEERKQKEEEKRQRDEEKRQRDEEKRQRDEEKKQRDEEKRRVREEEKKQKEEEKKRKENEKKKKDQNQLRLTSLFTKTIPMEKNTQSSNIVKSLERTKPSLFPPFYIKENVKMSKTNTFPITCTDNFMHLLKSQHQESTKETYLDTLSHKAKQKRGTTTHIDIQSLLLPGAADILHNSNVRLALGIKLLQYSEDVRPAYYGTFTKKSTIISGKHPLAKDPSILDYNVDSEAEWEPEGEGEDIHSDEDEDDPNADMNDPEDSNWLVPEGYLSDSEGMEDEDGHASKHKSHSSPSSRSSKRVVIRKVVLGPFFQGEGDEDEVMKPFELQFLTDSPSMGLGYDPFYKEPAPPKLPTTSVDSSFTEEHKSALINVINGKADSIPALLTEAKSNWLLRDVSKRQLEAKIKDMAIKEKRGADTKPTWYLKQNEPPSSSS